MKFTPLLKGVITGAAILVCTILLSILKLPASSGAQYLIYILYAAGIGWTVLTYSKTSEFTGKFGQLFNQGFKTFIIVTLIMVVFTWVYCMVFPEFGDQMAQAYKEAMVKSGDLTPTQMDQNVIEYRNSFTSQMVSMTIFQYLVLGALFTAVWSIFIFIRRNMQIPNNR